MKYDEEGKYLPSLCKLFPHIKCMTCKITYATRQEGSRRISHVALGDIYGDEGWTSATLSMIFTFLQTKPVYTKIFFAS